MAKNKRTASHPIVLDLSKLADVAKLTPSHSAWGTYLTPPLEGHPETERFLSDRNIAHSEFADALLKHRIAVPCFTDGPVLLSLAGLYAHHRLAGASAFAAAARNRAAMH